MRGEQRRQRTMLVVMNLEERIAQEHPLRRIKPLAEAVLKQLSPRLERMYSTVGRPSVPPERLLKASLLMALYTIRSERMLCEQLDYNLLFRWFLDLELSEPSFDHSTSSANRARLLRHEVAAEFFYAVVEEARSMGLLSSEHFTVDGTLIEAWASLKSFKRKDQGAGEPPEDRGNSTVNFHGERRSNATHQSTTDPQALLARKGKGKEAKLYYSDNALMENREGLLVGFWVEPADGDAERRSGLVWCRDRCSVRTGSRSRATRVTIRGASSPSVARSMSLLMWRKTTRGREVPHLMHAPPAIPAVPSANACANGLRKYSVG